MNIMKKIFAAAAIVSLMTSAYLFFYVTKIAAGTFNNAKLTISDSRAGQGSVEYDFAFTGSVGTAIKQWTIQFCTTASGTCTTPTGIVTTGATRSTDNISGTGRTDTFASNGILTTVATTPQTQSPLAMTADYTGITNPSTQNTTFYTRITTYADQGITTVDQVTIAFAVLTSSSISVTASVGNTLSFSVAAVTTGTVNGATINVTNTTDTAIPFGTLAAGSPEIAAHDVSVTTNANSGYAVAVKSLTNPPLESGSNNIDSFSGTNGTPTTWTAPAGTSPNINTGFFGYTTTDSTLGTGTVDRFTSAGGNKWAGFDTTPYEIIYNAGPVTGGETTRLGWQAEINTLQPTGNYAGTVILIATPTY